jgi:hypothetical protein
VKAPSPQTKTRLRPKRSAAPPEQQEAAEEQGVGRHHELEIRWREAEILLHQGEGDVHDRDVQDEHELGHAKQKQGEDSSIVPYRRCCHVELFLRILS